MPGAFPKNKTHRKVTAFMSFISYDLQQEFSCIPSVKSSTWKLPPVPLIHTSFLQRVFYEPLKGCVFTKNHSHIFIFIQLLSSVEQMKLSSKTGTMDTPFPMSLQPLSLQCGLFLLKVKSQKINTRPRAKSFSWFLTFIAFSPFVRLPKNVNTQGQVFPHTLPS